MMKLPQILAILTIVVISIARCKCGAKSNIVIGRANQYYMPASQKPTFKNYQNYDTTFMDSRNPITSVTYPTMTMYTQMDGSFSQSRSSFLSQTGRSSFSTASHTVLQPNDNLSGRNRQAFAQQVTENIPTIGENLLQTTTLQQAPIPPSATTGRRQNVPQNVPQNAPQNVPTIRPVTVNNNEDLYEQEWNLFKSEFNKTYENFQEDRRRREIFIENRNKIAIFNQEYGQGRHTFVQKINQYGDLLHNEFNRLINGFDPSGDGSGPEKRFSAYIPAANVNLPTSVDWRELGAVTPVKNQGMCGGCYAFSAAGAIEGQIFRRTGRLVDLSPQNIIDCTKSYSNKGCQRGVTDYSYQYVIDNRGLDREEFYPYEGTDTSECRYRDDGYGAHNTGYVRLDEGDERGLEIAVATVGPVSVAIDASAPSFQSYSHGMYFEPQCTKTTTANLNHGVLVVGYGTEPDGQQYWFIKNSYGPRWGIGGYMKLPKFQNNFCGIASYATYPLV